MHVSVISRLDTVFVCLLCQFLQRRRLQSLSASSLRSFSLSSSSSSCSSSFVDLDGPGSGLGPPGHHRRNPIPTSGRRCFRWNHRNRFHSTSSLNTSLRWLKTPTWSTPTTTKLVCSVLVCALQVCNCVMTPRQGGLVSPVSVCLSVCLSVNRITQKLLTNFYGMVGHNPGTSQLDFEWTWP